MAEGAYFALDTWQTLVDQQCTMLVAYNFAEEKGGQALEWFHEVGVTDDTIKALGAPGAGFVRFLNRDTFYFDGDGSAVVILPVTTEFGWQDAPWRRMWSFLDLIAFKKRSPFRMWTFGGHAAILNQHFMHREMQAQSILAAPFDLPPFDGVLPVYRDPVSLYRNKGNGIVVIDWERARPLMGHCRTLMVQDQHVYEKAISWGWLPGNLREMPRGIQ